MDLLINSLLRCVGHIVNLAQQAFISTLVGGESGNNRLEGPGVDLSGVGDHSGDEDELHLSGLESSTGSLIGPLLMHMRALVVWVRAIHSIVHDADIGLDSKVSWCEALPARLLHQSLYKTTRTHHVWEHPLGVMASID